MFNHQLECDSNSLRVIFCIVFLLNVSWAHAVDESNPTNRLFLIIGGSYAALREFPYYVKLTTQLGDYFPSCGGTLIGNDTVITAAHCVWDDNEPAKMVMVETTRDRLMQRSSERNFEAQNIRVIVHEDYYVDDIGRPVNDLAILKLPEGVVMDGEAGPQPIRLASRQYPEGTPVVLAGFGFTESGKIPRKLKKKVTVLVPGESLHNGSIYTQREDELAYVGDSGGPVVFKGETIDQDELVGIISFGDELGEGDREGHTDVHFYLDWINKHLD